MKQQSTTLKARTVTDVVGGSFFVTGGFSPIDAPTHFKVIAGEIYHTNNSMRISNGFKMSHMSNFRIYTYK